MQERLLTVVPAKAGTHIPEAGVMGPRNGVPATRASRGAPRGDDSRVKRAAIICRNHDVGLARKVKPCASNMAFAACERRKARYCAASGLAFAVSATG